jgi:hypothetical protein
LESEELIDSDFLEVSSGNTIIIKSTDGDTVKYIVAKNYAEFVHDIRSDDDETCSRKDFYPGF